MTAFLKPFLCAAFGYVIGSFNPAFLMGRHRGFDIRERGSGNAGTSNAVITMGKKVGAVVAVIDVAKACFAAKIGSFLFPGLALASEISGVSAVVGHMFPAQMNFRGGKGFACLGGVILAFSSRLFLMILIAGVALAVAVNYVCVVPITISALFPFLYFVKTRCLSGTLIYLTLFPLILYRHTDNLHNIREGREVHFSYLWDKEAELDRVSDKWHSDEYGREDLA